MKKNRIVWICVIIFSSFISVPIIMDIFVFNNHYITTISNEAWAGFLGSYFGGGFTLIAICFSMYGVRKSIKNDSIMQVKASRSFLYVENFQGNVHMSNYPSMSNNVKIIHNDLYLKVCNTSLNKTYSYQVLENLGNNPIYDCEINIKVNRDGNISNYKVTLPCIIQKSVIAIMVYDCEEDNQKIEHFMVNYKTIMNEKMMFEMDYSNRKQNHYLLDKNNENKEILIESKFDSINWTKSSL